MGDNWLMTVGYKTFGWRQVVNDMRLGYNRITNVRSQMTEKPPSERSLASTVYGVYTFDSIGLPAMLTETLLPLTIACVQLSTFNFYLIFYWLIYPPTYPTFLLSASLQRRTEKCLSCATRLYSINNNKRNGVTMHLA